jgi:accessory gene regulator protein AgrB
MIRFTKLQSNTNGNNHTVRSVLCIIMSLLMLIYTEMWFAVRFSSNEKIVTKFGVVT